jgi:hypothetical protein
MGNTNLECFRLYEALEAGAIPLLEKRPTLDYYSTLFGPHPIPTFTTWSQAARFVAALQNSPDNLNHLQTACLTWWESHKAALRTQAGAFLTTPSTDQPYLAHPHSKPWQYAELLRHQNVASLTWRLHRNATRLLTTGRLRAP